MSDVGATTGSPAWLDAILNGTPAYAGPIWITTLQNIASNLTVPIGTELHFVAGGILKPAAGVTITILGAVHAGVYQIFDLSAGGTISFAGNDKQDEFTAEWWMSNDYGSGLDCSARLNAMSAAVPDFTTINFRSRGTLSLGATWAIASRTGLKIRSPRHIEELPQVTLQCLNTIPVNGALNKVVAVLLQGCGHCEISGFQINCVVSGANNVAGIAMSFGGVRISTNNTVAHCRIENQGTSSGWTGIDISPDGGPNSEAMQIIGNWLSGGGTASAGLGTGIQLGQNSNNHMQFLFRNLTTGCRFGVDGQWFGAHVLHHISESDQTVFMIRHLPYPALIEFPDVESSQTILDTTATGGESSIVLRNGRFAGCGANGVGWFEFGAATPPTLIEACDFQNYSLNPNNSILYHLPWSAGAAAGQCIKTQSNYYNNLLGQGFPLANFIVRTGSTAGPLLPLDCDAEAITSGLSETYEINPAALNIAAGTLTLNGLQVNYVNTGVLSTIDIVTEMNYGNIMTAANNPRGLMVFIKAVGGAITVNTGGNIATSGTIAQNTIQQFMYDPAALAWYWVN